ncbi:MAG: segregation/condensation protein A [bacterium]|nr:MAG: segregation/condensation protein A [bacterium]
MAYRVKLQSFEGPLDLLLFLIKKNEVDIYDIPIAEITAQYLEYVEIIKLLDLDSASEFILLAATLIRIKARMLLPRPHTDEEEEITDPRMELVSRLLEYKKYKELAFKLSDLEEQQSKVFPRGYYHEFDHETDGEIELGEDVTLFSLISAFRQVLDRMPEETIHHIEDIQISLEEQIDYILSRLVNGKHITFFELISHIRDKLIIVVTFIALLELIKRGELIARQSKAFGEIWIARKSDRV